MKKSLMLPAFFGGIAYLQPRHFSKYFKLQPGIIQFMGIKSSSIDKK